MASKTEIAHSDWYLALLGQPPVGPLFARFSDEFGLEPWDGKNGWVEAPEGVSVRVRDGRIWAIIFLVAPQHGYTGCIGTLPFGLKQNMVREDVLRHLGTPMESRRSREDSALPPVSIDIYDAGAAELIVETGITDKTLRAVRLQLPVAE